MYTFKTCLPTQQRKNRINRTNITQEISKFPLLFDHTSYPLRVDGKMDTKKVEGVKSNVVARTIMFDDYTQCLQDEIEMIRTQSCIRSKLHVVYTISETNIALSPYDDKRYIILDSTDTLPWGIRL